MRINIVSHTGITILLGLCVYQTIANEKLPETSEAVPLLGKEITIINVYISKLLQYSLTVLPHSGVTVHLPEKEQK